MFIFINYTFAGKMAQNSERIHYEFQKERSDIYGVLHY